MSKPALYFASDHAGLLLKQALGAYAVQQNYVVHDLGTHTADAVDYPDYAQQVAAAMTRDSTALGVLICGSGVGMSIAANRHPHLRAALVSAPEVAALARRHNNANVLVFGARFITPAAAQECLAAFLSASFEGGRHQARVAKINQAGC